MTETQLQPSSAGPSTREAATLVNRPLLSSRERWQDLVLLGADLAFETNNKGRFTFVAPGNALGWPSGTLVGQPSALVLDPAARSISFNPFRANQAARAGKTWVRRYDGSTACLSFSTAPLIGANGRPAGTRGIGFDVTQYHLHASRIAGSLRRGEVLDFILWGVAQEVMAPRMMDAALAALVNALAADGAAVVAAHLDGRSELMHLAGAGCETLWSTAIDLAVQHGIEPTQTVTLDGRALLAVGCKTRFDARAALAVWRSTDPRPWDKDDILLARSAGGIIRMILEHEAIQYEMGKQARTDPLTGLLNRRAFMEEMHRHTDRLDQEGLPGTLMFVDMDCFKSVNDRFGHEVGDQVLMTAAALLRDLVRPTDLVGRFGGDEFAVWMSGADHLTAAERAERLRCEAPVELAAQVPEPVSGLGLSIGIATRRPGSHEPIDSLIRRADEAMYEVKRGGRGHWRVSLLRGD
ncbi:MAG: sensor domain-containing diguanylate cyclase [Acetobacteraceae bacterium]|nr:sensor domain-containing diguanylate cyclase [Pseudomonadota bacterium]